MHPGAGTRLRDLLEEEIVSGRLSPGTRLEEKVLAEQHGVSRTPVREALRQLAAAGLIEIRPRRGASVRAETLATLVQMFEMMAGLEATAGRLATRRLDEEGRARLLSCQDDCASASREGSDAYYYANEHFHFAIYRASGNAFLEDQAIALHRRLKPYRRMQLRSLNRVAQSLAEHQAVIDAILAGEEDRAAALLWDHVTIQADRFRDFVSGLQGGIAFAE